MDSIFQYLSANAPQAIFILSVLVVALLVLSYIQGRRIRKFRTLWKDLLNGASGENLERLLYDHLRERMNMLAQVDGLRERIVVLEDKMTGAKRHVGLVKYDAFEDVGGNQSFALAVYDDKGDGALLTSLIGRTDCRVYCKPLLGGKSERSLSQEEQRAIREAVESGPKSIVSH
jgi:hypothetical protein